jgi:hypothetical protein
MARPREGIPSDELIGSRGHNFDAALLCSRCRVAYQVYLRNHKACPGEEAKPEIRGVTLEFSDTELVTLRRLARKSQLKLEEWMRAAVLDSTDKWLRLYVYQPPKKETVKCEDVAGSESGPL